MATLTSFKHPKSPQRRHAYGCFCRNGRKELDRLTVVHRRILQRLAIARSFARPKSQQRHHACACFYQNDRMELNLLTADHRRSERLKAIGY
jgi:hypothetical protein